MKLSTSRRLDAQTKRELLKTRTVELKLKHLDNDAIAEQLFKEGIGVEKPDEPLRPYSGHYIGKVIRESLKEIAAERSGYGQELQVILDHDLETLINYWMPIALGKAVDNDGNPLPPSLKAADLVRKLTADRALLTGANEAKRLELAVKYESDVENFVNVLRELLDEETFSKILTAIDQATQLNSEYWSQNQKQIEGNSAIIDCEVLE